MDRNVVPQVGTKSLKAATLPSNKVADNLIAHSHGLPISSLIESIDNRDQLTSHTFECVTEAGTKFHTTMNGYSRDNAYRRLRIQTDGDILIAQ